MQICSRLQFNLYQLSRSSMIVELVSLINFLSQPQSLISAVRSAVVNIAAGKCRWRGGRQHCRRRWCHTGFRLPILGQMTRMPSPHVSSGHSGYILTQFCKNVSQPTGFEPVRGDPIGFRVQLLNHSDTTAGWREIRFSSHLTAARPAAGVSALQSLATLW